MSATTKLELQQLLAAANAERESLRIALSKASFERDTAREHHQAAELMHTVACKQIAELEKQLEAAKAHGAMNLALRANQRVRPVFEPSPEVLARRAAMAAAKEEAMRTGHVVKV